MVTSQLAKTLALGAAGALLLLALGCGSNGNAATAIPGPTPTPIPAVTATVPAPPPADDATDTANGSGGTAGVFLTPIPAPAALRPVTPPGWAAPLIIAGEPEATASGPIGGDGAVYVSWAIENGGDTDVDAPFSVDLLLDGVPVERWAATGLAAGETQAVRDWAALPNRARLAPGAHMLELRVDATGYVQPLTAPGNTATAAFDWPAAAGDASAPSIALARLPNLTPFAPAGWDDALNLTGVPETRAGIAQADPALQIGYRNGGLSSISGAFLVYVYLDGVLVTKYNQHGLIADEAVASPPWRGLQDIVHLTPSEHTLTLVLDPTGLVTEADESDNTATVRFTWGGPAALSPTADDAAGAGLLAAYTPSEWNAPLHVTSYAGATHLPNEAYLSSQAYVSWALHNPGASATDAYAVEVVVSAEPVARWERQPLAPGAIDIVADMPIPPAFAQGIHKVELRVRPAGGPSQTLAEAPTRWWPGFVPPRADAPLTAEERRVRINTLEAVRSSVLPLNASSALTAGVRGLADLVYRDLYGRSLWEDRLTISILTDAEFGAMIQAECAAVAPTLSGIAQTLYLQRCSVAQEFVGYYTDWEGVPRIVVRGSVSPMEALSTIAHELGHYQQARVNPALSRQVTLNLVALREAQAYAHQTLFMRTLERAAGLDLLLYPSAPGYTTLVQTHVATLRDRAASSEHARGQLLLWVALLSDPELRSERTELLNNLAVSAETARAVFERLIALTPGEGSAYVRETLRNASTQIEAIEALMLARLTPGLPYWNEGSPDLREVGLLLP